MPQEESAGQPSARSDRAREGRLAAGDLAEMYRLMVLSRALDDRVWQLNRQGKAAIAASVAGHEAAQVGCVWAADPARDHFLIYYREFATLLALGVTPEELLLGFLAKSGEPMSGARQFPLHGALRGPPERPDVVCFSNVVGTQLPQAAGFALADRMRGEPSVTIVFFGEGASSTGDAHEAMNFAGVHGLPVVFFCENNRYTTSVPLDRQVAGGSVAARASGYGFPGVTVDGTDVVAVFEATHIAVERARSGDGPTLVEAMVERFRPHTTDDDHTRYRSAEDIAAMGIRDPLDRTERLLRERDALDDAQKERVFADGRRAVDEATERAEAAPFPPPSEMYRHVTTEPAVES